MSKIFISYRRDDSSGTAGRLYDRLEARFGAEQVFIDVDTIEPGVDFVEAVQRAIAGCEVMLLVIGRHWVDACYRDGRRRLDDPSDTVRVEIETALASNVRIIPVLVGNAVMPNRDLLPETLSPLARINGLEIAHQRFREDVDMLSELLQRLLAGDHLQHHAAKTSGSESSTRSSQDAASLVRQLPSDLCIETQGGIATVVISGGTSLPVETQQGFSTAEDNQSGLGIQLLLGGNHLAADNVRVMTFNVDDIAPAPRGVPKIDVHFRIDEQCVLHVSARDPSQNKTWQEQRVDLNRFTVPKHTDPHRAKKRVGFKGVFYDLWDDIFGIKREAPSKDNRGADLTMVLPISAQQALTGDTVQLQVSRFQRCDSCHGRSGNNPCSVCGAAGRTNVMRGFFTMDSRCDACQGTGHTGCHTCDGSGLDRRLTTLSVKIPPGVKTGSKLRLQGCGDADVSGSSGDLYVELEVKAD